MTIVEAPTSAVPGHEPILVLAVPKGRILEETAAIFARAGYDLSPALGDSRKLVFECGPLRVLVLRSSDIATYVDLGAADVGVAGSDVLDEEGRDLYEPLDLGIGRCRMIVAERADQPIDERSQMHLRIATKYPRLTKAYLASRGIDANRMRTISYGKERPVAVCNDISCWSQNRRAVTVLNASS